MEMFFYGFMQRAFQASMIIAIIAPLLGLFLIIRRQSLMADTLSHVSLAGVAFGLVLNVNPSVTTLIVVVIAALGMEYLRGIYTTYSELSIAILMAGGLAVALVLMNLDQGGMTTSVQQYLFGSIVTISKSQVQILLILGVSIVILFLAFKRFMFVLTFSEDVAVAEGVPVRVISLLFSVVTGIAIAFIMPIAGALLVSALIILPAAIGMRLAKGFLMCVVSAIFIGLLGMFSGLVSSYQLGTPPGATITLMFILIFIVVAFVLKFVRK
ncbi:metal ABC transporter permease [Listeria ivanovii]|uniref:Metal ABC transporter permease n=2 Tax=Listeria ivanovii TaxID=1638 RepID=A0ABS1G1U9_LISIV|nr:metal ABC transporter permease [Listeria ivanovii]AIS58623.1 zinc ABC transporter permease [Listeria ivanovii subsp. londoniensis]AIS61429.1 zinc ABC transporter permease [Listeria ivanovii subsp. londoniensis]MBK1960852.1 metal ABC transporter permease [Listeria ivanovii subsp. londoniensis]MBK1966086.1 metal ABC transporter permease [Listeria ivanovii subsp. londoniensis]MBK1985382.1 metal ABC transporter permease [Listeria ivanovii subsp. londoniensis]